MRHTLLPLNERKALRLEYRVRLFVVCLFFVSLVGLVGVGALFPAFMRARAEERAQLDLAEQIKKKNDTSGYSAIEGSLRDDEKLVEALDVKPPTRMSGLAESIIALRQSLTLTSFTFTEEGTSSVSVNLFGKAGTREELLAFKSRLENSLPGTRVDLPYGELAKSADIPFSLSIHYKL